MSRFFLPISILIFFIIFTIKVAGIFMYAPENKSFVKNDSKKIIIKKELLSSSETNKISEAAPAQSEKENYNIYSKRPIDQACSKPKFSEAELEILQSLAKRRKKLDQREKEIEAKEALFVATQMKIQEKIDTLNKLKKDVENILVEYNKKEDAKIDVLVQIYQNMKPKDAAKIFETLDIDLILQILNKMDKNKSSPILSLITPERATEISMEFANQKKLPIKS